MPIPRPSSPLFRTPGRQADTRALCALLAEVTGEPAVMWGTGIIGFGVYHYRYQSGHEDTSVLAGFAPRKARLVLCLVGGFEDRHQELLARLGPHKAGNPYLKRLADVDLDVLRDLVDRSVRVRREVDRASGAPQAQ